MITIKPEREAIQKELMDVRSKIIEATYQFKAMSAHSYLTKEELESLFNIGSLLERTIHGIKNLKEDMEE